MQNEDIPPINQNFQKFDFSTIFTLFNLQPSYYTSVMESLSPYSRNTMNRIYSGPFLLNIYKEREQGWNLKKGPQVDFGLITVGT